MVGFEDDIGDEIPAETISDGTSKARDATVLPRPMEDNRGTKRGADRRSNPLSPR